MLKIKEPKDLGIKILNEEAAFWEKNKTSCEAELKHLNDLIKINSAILDTINRKLNECKPVVPKKNNLAG